MRKARFLIVAAVVVLGAVLADATPYPGYYYPSGMQAGTKMRMVVGGTSMGNVFGVHVSGEGVRVTKIVRVPGFPRATGKTQIPWVWKYLYDLLEGKTKGPRKLPPEALEPKSDWYECLWWPYMDELGSLELQVVARWLYTPLNYPQPTPALDNILLLDIEADANAEPGRRDIIMYDDSSASQPHSFYITKEPHVRELFFVTPPRSMLHEPNRLPRALHLPTELDPVTPPCYIDGQAWPGETDQFKIELKKGQHLVCALTGREMLPYLGDAVPGFFNPELRLLNAKGHRVAEADDFHYLPDPVLRYTAPADGIYTLEVCDNLYRGRADFVYFVHCYTTENDCAVYTPQERAFECFPPAEAQTPLEQTKDDKVVIKGNLDTPGRVNRHFFDVAAPGAWKFDLFARRMGSPIDGVLKLYGPIGNQPVSAAPLLATWDDVKGKLYNVRNVGNDETPIIKTNYLYVGSVPQVECDPSGIRKIWEAGKYCVTVSDRIGGGGENYDYTLTIEPAKPSFEVYSEVSAFVYNPEHPPYFKLYLVRNDGFSGQVMLESSTDWFAKGIFEPGEVEVDATVEPVIGRSTWKGIKEFQLYATGRYPDGREETVRVTPCDPVEQAFAYTHLLPQRSFFYCMPGTNLVAKWKHPLPHLRGDAAGNLEKKFKSSHANGQACTHCHRDRTRKHTHGKACISCHKNKE